MSIVDSELALGSTHGDYSGPIKLGPSPVIKLWFWNKNHALELFFKHHGLMEPEPEDPGEQVPTFIFPPGTQIAIK